MFIKVVTERLLIHKVSIPFVQRDVVRITVLVHLGQPVVTVDRDEPCVFVPISKRDNVQMTQGREVLNMSLRFGILCISHLFGADIEADFRAGRAADGERVWAAMGKLTVDSMLLTGVTPSR